MDPVFGQAKDVRGLLRGMTLNVLARLAAAFEGRVQASESIGVHGIVVQASSRAARVFTAADSLSPLCQERSHRAARRNAAAARAHHGQRRVEAHQVQSAQFSLGRPQPIEDAVFRAAVGVPVGLPIATGVDTVMQLNGQRQETLLLQQGRQILKQPFGAGKFAEAIFGGELPAGGGAHKDRGRRVVDGRHGEG